MTVRARAVQSLGATGRAKFMEKIARKSAFDGVFVAVLSCATKNPTARRCATKASGGEPAGRGTHGEVWMQAENSGAVLPGNDAQPVHPIGGPSVLLRGAQRR